MDAHLSVCPEIGWRAPCAGSCVFMSVSLHPVHLPLAKSFHRWALVVALVAGPGVAQAQQQASGDDWQLCRGQSDEVARLACFDRWAAAQSPAATSPSTADTGHAAWASTNTGPAVPAAPVAAAAQTGAASGSRVTRGQDERPCSDPRNSQLSRFWELEPDSDCGTFGIRGYRPLSLSWIGSDSVNTAPSSPSAGHTVTTPVAYSTSENRIQLSVRTKIARGLLTDGDSPLRDSLWFGYTQQSYWQLFNASISRPFRSTDHEPELTYILPTDVPLDGGWRLRYGGLSLNHQSNGQSLPLSRSWNRIILMAGMEKDDRFTLTGRVWARVPERSDQDDNPDIADYVGRAEVSAAWNVDKINTLGITLRHSLRTQARGSVRLEWLRAIGTPRANGEPGGLRFHTQLFRGYGDSLLDYNRRRTVLSVGLSLVDF
jgi:phospholipase A1/A2